MAAKRMKEHDHPRYRFNKRLLEHAKSKTQSDAEPSGARRPLYRQARARLAANDDLTETTR